MDDIRAAMSEIVSIQSAEIKALLAEDFDKTATFQARLNMVRMLKKELIEKYREHVTSHGC